MEKNKSQVEVERRHSKALARTKVKKKRKEATIRITSCLGRKERIWGHFFFILLFFHRPKRQKGIKPFPSSSF